MAKMERVTQADFLNQDFKEAKEHIIEIYDEIQTDKSNIVFLLLRKTNNNNFGICKYNSKTKKELIYASYDSKNQAEYWFNNLKTT